MAHAGAAQVLTQLEVERFILQGRMECEWVATIHMMEDLFSQYSPYMGRYWLEGLLRHWPVTLLARLPWGPYPILGS